MLNRTIRPAAYLAVLMLSCTFVASAQAERHPDHTVITVKEMCGGCVKKITKRFKDAKAIADLKCDIKTKTVTMVPAEGFVFNPRGLWEAMEKIGKTPTKMAGPSGTFTSKPKKKQ